MVLTAMIRWRESITRDTIYPQLQYQKNVKTGCCKIFPQARDRGANHLVTIRGDFLGSKSSNTGSSPGY